MCRGNAKYVNEGLHFVGSSVDVNISTYILILFLLIVKSFLTKRVNTGTAENRGARIFEVCVWVVTVKERERTALRQRDQASY